MVKNKINNTINSIYVHQNFELAQVEQSGEEEKNEKRYGKGGREKDPRDNDKDNDRDNCG